MHANRQNDRLNAAPDHDAFPGGNPWLLIGVIVGAKAATIVAILFFSMSYETGGFVLLTHWHWLPMLGALVAAPVGYAIRVRRVRSRREALRRSEWLLSGSDTPESPSVAPPVRTVDSRLGGQ
jgi:hypothetical protein